MSSNARQDLLALLPTLETPDDFSAWDEMAATLPDEAEDQNQFVLQTLGQVAEFFDQALQTVKQWRMESPPMPGDDSGYPLRDIVRWRIAKVQQSDLAAAKRQQEYDLGEILVESKRIELEEKKRTILDRHDVELWAATALVELREGIMQLPEMLAASAPEGLRNFVREETDRHCRDLLTATARRLELSEIGKGEPQEE